MVMFIILIIQAFFKVLWFMKIFAEYGFLVQMVYLSILDAMPFFAFFVIWILFFTIIFQVLNMEYEESDYPGMNQFYQLFIVSSRNSLGDISIPKYT